MATNLQRVFGALEDAITDDSTNDLRTDTEQR
jgi:hypothetical protein